MSDPKQDRRVLNLMKIKRNSKAIKKAYNNGVSVITIAKKLNVNRSSIYRELKAAGVNTHLGYALIERKPSPIGNYLDFEWVSDIGKSPKKIAELTGFKYSSIVNTLRKRRDYLTNKMERIRWKNDVDILYTVDPYNMSVEIATTKNEKRIKVVLSEEDLIELLRKDAIATI